MKPFNEARKQLDAFTTNKEKLDYLLHDFYDENGVEPIERIGLFIGLVYETTSTSGSKNLFAKDLRTVLDTPVTKNPYANQYANPISIFIQPNNRKRKAISAGDFVVLTLEPGKLEKAHELFNADLCLSFSELNNGLDHSVLLSPDMPPIIRAKSLCECHKLSAYKDSILSMLESMDVVYEKVERLSWLEKQTIQEKQILDELIVQTQSLEKQKRQFDKDIEQLKTAISKLPDLRKEYDEFEKKLPALREEKKQCQEIISMRDTVKSERDALQQEKSQLEEDLPILRAEKQKLSDELVDYWKIKKEYDQMASRKKAIQFSQVPKSDYVATPAFNFNSPNEGLELFKKRLLYDYRDEDIHKFLMALGTTQIITLCGDPGTGKTTFVEEMCTALGAQCHMIEVQNNWTDKSDILGYYNPLDGGKYQSTLFLDALLYAKEDLEQNGDKARLHIICLDEMNLAKIEYYFALFLSLLQRRERTLYLLPKDLDMLAMDESSDLYRYRHFDIPKNVRFVGTLNMDETAQGLSPKVIDRCFFIEFDKGISKQKKRDEISGYYPASIFEENLAMGIPAQEQGVFSAFETENARFMHYAHQMYSVANMLSIDDNLFGDYLILGKVLPRIKEVKEFGSYRNKRSFIKSQARFNQFVQYGDRNQFCDYWRKK